ncbi:MAG: DUF6684 family protein [Haloarculaceae archaeon]
MTQSVFDRETLLDLTVNAIPLAILLFFLVVFAVMNPFGPATVVQAIQFSIVGVMFLALAVLTYYSWKAVATAEQRMEHAEQASVESQEALHGVEEEPEGELESGEEEPAEVEGETDDAESAVESVAQTDDEQA